MEKQVINLKGFATKFLRSKDDHCVFLFHDHQYGKLVCHAYGENRFVPSLGEMYNLTSMLKGFVYTKGDGREFVNNGLLVLGVEADSEQVQAGNERV